MPLNLSPEDRRLLLVASSVFLVCALLAIFLSPSQADQEFATSYSTASKGAKATFLLLQESGYQVERWRRPPSELRDPRSTLLVLTDPTEIPSQADRAALAKFLDDGGTLVVAGGFAGIFLSEPAPLVAPVSLGWQTFKARAPAAQALNAPEIKLDESAYWPKAKGGIALYGDDSHLVVMRFSRGSGAVVWLASATPVTNAGLRESDNLEFLLSTIGGKSRHVLWDEYFHGYRDTTPVAMSHPQVVWLFGQLGFVAVAVLVTFSRRSGPQRAPRPESRQSPLEFAHALGDLYQHAKASNVAVDIAYERFRYTLAKRLGLKTSATSQEFADAVALRWPVKVEELRSLLDTCESSRFFEDLTQKEALALVQRLHEYSVRLKLLPDAAEETP